jgi:hypothetical protein
MTAFLVAFQGFTYKMTRVTLSICLTSGVHLNRSVDRAVELGLSFCFQQSAMGGWGLWLRDAGRRT